MSSSSPILNFVIRGFQIVFGAVVLGLSVGLIRGQAPTYSSPLSLRYCAFVGGISFLGGFIGVAAEWVSVLQGNVGLLIDAIVTLLNIAGGVLLAILIGVPKCGDKGWENQKELMKNSLFNGGCDKEFCFYDYRIEGRENQLNARCMECQADSVFMFFLVATLLVSATMTFLRTKKGY